LKDLVEKPEFESVYRERVTILRELYQINYKMSLLHAFQGIDLSRGFEYTQAYTKIPHNLPAECLDIGSYRSPFPIFMAHAGYRVSIIDLSLGIGNQNRWAHRILEDRTQLRPIVADGKSLPFSNVSFDIVTAISVVEHIPDGGEKVVLKEMGRVLSDNGKIFISVPYAVEPFKGKWGRWYQQWFNYETALENLVAPSNLQLAAHGFMLGGKVGRFADLWYRLPRQLRHSLSWSHIHFLPRLFIIDEASETDARVLWLLLNKA
jgi:SAM-dependent methyltransferase